VIATAGVIVSVATGIVTNTITSRWSWTLGAVLVVLIVAGIFLAIQGTSGSGTPTRRSRASIKARRGARIDGSGVTGSNGADVKQTASREGSIVSSPVTADGSDVRQNASSKAEIKDSPVNLP
jgi:hypothetical protein